MSQPAKRIVVTAGEPAGIGPDLCVQMAQAAWNYDLTVCADPALLRDRADQLGLPLKLVDFDPEATPAPLPAGQLRVLPVSLCSSVVAGRLDAANAPYVLDTLRLATQACLDRTFHALVTGPVHKGIINEAGIPFTGHTEFLAALCHTPQVVMMLATEGLRVALATTHVPLRQVSDHITRESLTEIIHILHRDLQKRLGIADPRIFVCGLNPHAGESGHLGREELDTILPVLEQLRTEHIRLYGPLPADTLFVPKYLNEADAVLAMYHDQGLPVLKHMGFGRAINITLGLPIIRTSVDHGTALELAATGKADPTSLYLAIETAGGMQ